MSSGQKAALIVVGIAIGASVLFAGYGAYAHGTKRNTAPTVNTKAPVYKSSKDDDSARGGITKRRKSIRKSKTKNKNSNK